MRKLSVYAFLVIASFVSVKSFASSADCRGYFYNLFESSNTLRVITNFKETRQSDFHIINVQKQSVDYYLGIKYSLASNIPEASSESTVMSTAKYLYCSFATRADVTPSGFSNLYVGFSNELQRDLFYKMITTKNEVILSLDMVTGGYSDVSSIDKLKISIGEVLYSGFELEIKLAEQMPKLFPRIANKIIEAINEERINLADVDETLSNASQISNYLKKSVTNRSINEYVKIVGLEKESDLLIKEDQYTTSFFAYLLFLKKNKPSYLEKP